VRSTAIVRGAVLLVVAGCSGHQLSDDGPLAGVWGSDQAGLIVSDGATTLQITSGGNCYGSYAVTTKSIPNGQFAVPGTYTQLTGAYPGTVDYVAQLTGTVSGNQMSIAISVPSLPRTIGPFTLIRGVNAQWSQCLYP
jgi:hypothetical protein